MAIRFQIYHPERIIVGVAEGVVTLKDIIHFALEIAQHNAAKYSKIVDVMGGTPMLSEADMAAYRDRIHDLPADQRPTGLLALVTNEEHGDLARMFAKLTVSERPVNVFKSIHDARKWLRDEQRAAAARLKASL